MAEAVATLALVSSILQVIDFGTKVASTASKVYQASKRDDGSLNELEKIYKNLSSTLDTIQTDDAAMGDSGDLGLKSLSKDCSQVARELVNTLHKLGFGEAKTKRKALRVALKHAWKDGKIRSLQARLNEFRSQLTMCLLVSIRQFAGQSASKQGEILEKLGKIEDGPIGASVLDYVTSGLDASSQQQHRQLLESDLIETIRDQRAIHGDDNNLLKIETTQKVYKKSMNLLLRSLEYSGMHSREENIVDAHKVTFRWIFENDNDKWVSFRDWLESDNKLYWITGKPGSGKTTMMKYISHSCPRFGQQFPKSRSHKYLERWAGSKKLVVASFYFWNSGHETQTTQRGLFMSLLRQIFKQCPDLLPQASRSRWENLCLFGMNPDWADSELRSLLLSCIGSLGKLNVKVALFVDGLDEFGGDLTVLMTLFEEIQKLPHHKLCVASRPWNEFRDAFAHSPSLMIEHLTHDDIKNFVVARFDSDTRFVQLRLREPYFANQLAEDIVSKSSGVFLWVSLVVTSLLSGMGNGDRIVDFQRRLGLLPPDLSDLYRKMIEGLDHFYLEHTAQLFALVGASRQPMNLLLASYVDEEDPRIALQQEVTPLLDQDVQVRMDTMRRRINSRSRGLLEVGGRVSTPQRMIYSAETHRQFTVQYLHRTVKDFIETDSAIQKILETALPSTFDPHLMLLAGHLAYLKKTRPRENEYSDISWGEQLIDCFFNARGVQANNVDTMIEILDTLGKLRPSDLEIFVTLSLPNRFELAPENHVWTPNNQHVLNFTFLSLATACHVVEYIRARHNSTSDHKIRSMSLLGSAISPTLHDDGHFTREPPKPTRPAEKRYRATIEVLLEYGENPKMDSSMMVGQTSPLVMTAVQYMHTQHVWYLIACRALAKNLRYDSTTIACIIHGYMEIRRFSAPSKKRLGANIWSWYLLKKDVRKALNDTVHGCPPDFDKLWETLIVKRLPTVTRPLSRDKSSYSRRP